MADSRTVRGSQAPIGGRGSSQSEMRMGGCPRCGKQGCVALSCGNSPELPELVPGGIHPSVSDPEKALKDRVRQLEKALREAKATNHQLQLSLDRAVMACIGTLAAYDVKLSGETAVLAQHFVETPAFSEILPDDLEVTPWFEAQFKEMVHRRLKVECLSNLRPERT